MDKQMKYKKEYMKHACSCPHCNTNKEPNIIDEKYEDHCFKVEIYCSVCGKFFIEIFKLSNVVERKV